LKGSGLKESVVLLDIGADNTDLIITDGTRIWQRNVPIGGNHFTRALTKELKLTFAKAEHLKRNATKAADPRSIFTAMRGIFNDFASEINRSIGFYSSINRTAKIRKVVGLGNGFKLPGLQKFLQQNLNHEVTRIEGFEKMVGDEVKSAPQFQDNLASFGVAYGLGVQGLNRGGLGTNLLPPEIEMVRLVRAKKPWALAASALIMLGLTLLFALGDYRVLAKVTTPQFASAVSQAKSVSTRGAALKTAFEKSKGEWQAEYDQGKGLITDPSDRAMWPQFLKLISAYFPDPEREYGLDPDDPESQDELEKLRVHIDAIKPVWRTDLNAEWFELVDANFKRLMHPIDAGTPPSGEGWVVQLVCHHYNPYPNSKTQAGREQMLLPVDDPKRTDFGPYQFLTEKVLKKLNSPSLRLYGIDHIALAWIDEDKEWTSEKGSQHNNLASKTVPLLDRAAPPADAGGGGPGGGGGMANMMSRMGGGRGGAMGGGAMGGGMGGGGMGRMGRMGEMGGMGMGMGEMGGRLNDKDAKDKLKLLTRTDFLLQFVWKPVKPDELPKTEEDQKAKIKEIVDKMLEAQKNNPAVTMPKAEELQAASLKKSAEVDTKIEQSLSPGGGPGGAPGVPAVPGAPGVGAPPPAAKKNG
jgi:type IV pilus assembly protein PilM